ncbi:MAG: hypothetical protein QM756_16920 [Polyangiaceae bacterium]
MPSQRPRQPLPACASNTRKRAPASTLPRRPLSLEGAAKTGSSGASTWTAPTPFDGP